MCQDSVEYPSTMILLPDLPNLIYRTFKLRAQTRIHSVNRKFVLIYRNLNNKDGQNVVSVLKSNFISGRNLIYIQADSRQSLNTNISTTV